MTVLAKILEASRSGQSEVILTTDEYNELTKSHSFSQNSLSTRSARQTLTIKIEDNE